MACVVEPSISNMGYVTLVEDEETHRRSLPKSGNAEGATVTINPMGGRQRAGGHDASGAGPRHRDRPGGRRHAGHGPGRNPGGCRRPTRPPAPGPSPRATTPPGSRGSGSGRCCVPPRRWRPSYSTIAAHVLEASPDDIELAQGSAHGPRRRRSPRSRCAAWPGWRTGTRRDFPSGSSPGLASTSYYAAPELDPAQPTIRSRRRPRTGSLSTSRPSRSTRGPASVTVLDYVSVHDAGRCSTPCWPRGRSSADSPTDSVR